MKQVPARTRIVVGNWKMNPVAGGDAKKIVATLKKKLQRASVPVVVVPPAIHLEVVRSLVKKPFSLGVQDVHQAEKGAFTGSISAAMAYGYGARYAILGHSERRRAGETNDDVGEKVRVTLGQGMTPIICVGETERDHAGRFYSFVETEIREALRGVSRAQVANVIVAYEPVWAISTGDGRGQTATPEHAHEMKLFIQKVLVALYGRTIGLRVPVLYGGSVNPGNAEELMAHGDIDGFLVGGASLKPDEFTTIVRAVEAHK